MSRSFKIFILVVTISVTILALSWFVPIVPTLNTRGYGIPGCKIIEFRNIEYFMYSNYRYNQAGKHQDPPSVQIAGICSIN
jgi:hypothetical protein